MGKNKDNEGKQQGALNHAPSQQGERTRSRQAEIANSGSNADANESSGARHDPEEIRTHSTKGRDRLFEDREQHDEADKNSEKTRLARDLDRHNHTPEDELSHRERQSMAKRKN